MTHLRELRPASSRRLGGSSDTRPRVYAVIPCHNGVADTLECLALLERSDYPALEIVVIDDGSVDGTVQRVALAHPAVTVLGGDGDLWWAGAVNLGIREALQQGADYVMLLNNDCVVAPDLVSQLVCCARGHPGAIIGSRVYDYDQPSRIWFTGGRMDWWHGGTLFIHPRELAAHCEDEPISVDWLGGMGVLIPRHILERVGLMQAARLPQYWADSDFCLRARRAGFEVLIEPRARLWNKVASSGITHERAHMTWSRWRLAFTSLKSQLDWRTTRFFFQQHCPRWCYPFGLARFYYRNVHALLRRSLEEYVLSHPSLLSLARWLLGKTRPQGEQQASA